VRRAPAQSPQQRRVASPNAWARVFSETDLSAAFHGQATLTECPTGDYNFEQPNPRVLGGGSEGQVLGSAG
jgi:hypothetical protein